MFKSKIIIEIPIKFCAAVNKEKGIFSQHLFMWSEKYDFS